MTPQIVDTGRLPAIADTPEDNPKACHDHDDDGQHFKEREPELQLAEDFHADQIDRADDQHHAEHPGPLRHIREPDTHINAERGYISDGDDQDFETVRPAGDVTRHRPEVILRITR